MWDRQASGSAGGLEQLSFGWDDAESDIRADRGGLLRAGFVRTAAFEAVLAGRKHLVIGRTGSGKSAICRELAAEAGGSFAASVVTPGEVSPEELRRAGLQGATASVSAELLWRYVLGITVARYVAERAAECGGQAPRSAERLRKFLAENDEGTELRLHRPLPAYLGRLRSLSLGALGTTVSVQVGEPGQARHASDQLEAVERAVLAASHDVASVAGPSRLLLLADELERLWSADEWSGALVSGLLLAARHVTGTFPGVECVTFLRTDIYDALQFPHKDRFRGEEARVTWTADSLRDLVLARARASAGRDLSAGRLWGELFPAVTGQRPTADHLISRTLGRPRDLIQLVRKCQETALDQGRDAATAADIREAEASFSGWKRQDLVAEYQSAYPFLAAVLGLFEDSTYIVPRQRLADLISAGLPSLREQFPAHASVLTPQGITRVLYETGFLGVRREQRIVYSHSRPAVARPRPDERAYYIHPCFRPALGASRAASVQEAETWRITLWGAPGSGKTTFLAALGIAASQSAARPAIYGRDDPSTRFLTEATRQLTTDREFPAASDAGKTVSYALDIPALGACNDLPAPAVPTEFSIDFADEPGIRFSHDGGVFRGWGSAEDAQLFGDDDEDDEDDETDPLGELTDYLAESDGFILQIDPARQWRVHDAYNYFADTLHRIAQRCWEQGRTGDGWLPHYLAVCVTKFDLPDVYQRALDSGICPARPDGASSFPRVPDDKAAEFFTSLCSETGASAIPTDIARYFHPDRTRYFITSSIGFYRAAETAPFDEHDCLNLVEGKDGRWRLRGGIYPINVVEPVLWLGRCLTTIEE